MNTQKQSLVRVWIPGGGYTSNTYYNDRFDLKPGDIVFVEDGQNGKSLRGIVTSLIKTFKIRVSDYKKVIAAADTSVRGRMHLADSFLFSFDKNAIPYERVVTWLKPPCPEDDYVIARDDEGAEFSLDDLETAAIPDRIKDRGKLYYRHRRVKYLEVDGERGRAIVDGTQPYEVEFIYRDGKVSGLLCDCPYMETCKHEYAVMLQLKETLDLIYQRYPEELPNSLYFAAVSHSLFMEVVMDSGRKGSFLAEF